jgi:hypothetical protein
MSRCCDSGNARHEFRAILELDDAPRIRVGLGRGLRDIEEGLCLLRCLAGDLGAGPERVFRLRDMDRRMWLMITASIAPGSTPAAARFFAIRPSVGAKTFEVPVSISTSLSPVLTSHSFTEVLTASGLRNALARSFSAPSGVPEYILAPMGSQPSFRTVTSMVPTFRR